MKNLIWLLAFSCTSTHAFAAAEKIAHMLSVGQGTAFPGVTTTMNFSTGVTAENAVGLVYQEGMRATAEYIPAETGGKDTMGAELGYGGQGWGLGVGYLTCDGCEATTVGGVALEVANWFALGLRFQKELYSLGMIFNSSGNLRLGVTADLNDPEGDGNNIGSVEVGLAYVSGDFVFAVDAGTKQFEDKTNTDKRLYITPGIELHAGILQVSLNYKIVSNDPDKLSADDKNFWFGVGLGDKEWHLAFYSDYVANSAFALSYFF